MKSAMNKEKVKKPLTVMTVKKTVEKPGIAGTCHKEMEAIPKQKKMRTNENIRDTDTQKCGGRNQRKENELS